MQVLYLIPARSGSKGLPGKNIRQLGNKPLIAHSIDAAKSAIHKGRIFVSTDDAEIAEIAKQAGAEVPFIRPAELSTDSASTMDVIMHTLNWCKDHHINFDMMVLLQPTSPLRSSADIDAAIKLLTEKKADAIVSVCETEHHPLWSNTLPENCSMKNFLREDVKGLNRQQLPVYYRLNGAIYLSKVSTLIQQKGFLHNSTYAYVMPQNRSIDIDHELDFMMAELLINKFK